MFYEVYGPVTRDPGAGSPENLKTVTSGSLANASCNLITEQGTEPEIDSTSEMRIGFLGAL
ncbi:hypothetical protein GNF76_02175 [Pseudomonas sp. CCM 7893]|uniref:Uncharacterized protein n=1 Tax=Pseudomonas spelaei TaxID=1055469 RepID=A0A6I3W7K6_9PSED|nr:hypothetical protein [Pseudomonas spelaei]MUF03122.1 hypothetical protein [Pseudomonas spelaei]QLG90411.1 hypothetical protein HZF02_06715 [Pseudomonas yamanorum]